MYQTLNDLISDNTQPVFQRSIDVLIEIASEDRKLSSAIADDNVDLAKHVLQNYSNDHKLVNATLNHMFNYD